MSCFTATAKPKVISDIREYFREKCGVELSLFATTATRSNLRYEVLFRENDDKKYATLRTLIEAKKCPTIVYVTRTKRAEELAVAMDARCYQGGKGKTKLHPLRLKRADVLWTLILIVVAFIPLAVDLLQNLK